MLLSCQSEPSSEQRFYETSLIMETRDRHDPDIGSVEWRSTVEARLNLEENPETPKLDSQEWCNFIDQKAR